VAPAYDFIHSALVFQHIRQPEGYAAFRELVAGLSSGGRGVVHFLVRTSLGPRQVVRSLRARSRALGRAAAILNGAPLEAAMIEVHDYDLGSS
jgi:hypothetical protein